MRKKITNNKELKNGVRVDNTYSNLLRQFNLDGSSSKNGTQPPRFGKLSARPSSILYICLFLGLSIGISSAFADREIFPSTKPLDQPVQQKAQASQPQGEKAKIGILPQDQKQELIVEKSQRMAEEKRVKSHEHSVEQKTDIKNTGSDHVKAEQSSLSSKSTEKTKSVSEPKSDMTSTPTTAKDTPATETPPVEQNTTAVEKSTTTPTVPSSSHAFKTEVGGKLPATAGNNLNHVLLGLLIACVGVVAIPRKRMSSR